MATTKKPAKKPAKKQTLRERNKDVQERKPRRLRTTGGHIKRLPAAAKRVGKKVVIPLPDNKFGRGLRKVFRIIGRILLPKFFRLAWIELKQVTWPGRRETWRLTMSVFIFAVVFAIIVGFLDFGLDKLFKELIVKK